MKKWVNVAMLVTLMGSIASPIVGSAVEVTNSSTSSAVNGSTIRSVASDPQTLVSSTSNTATTASSETTETTSNTEKPVEATNQLEFDKKSTFKEKDAEKNQYELELVGKVVSSTDNHEKITFEMTKEFTPLETATAEKSILDEGKQEIGTYTVDTTGERNVYQLNFNKLVKGENRFKLILLGTIARGPDKQAAFYQNDKRLFQLALPEIPTEESSTEASSSVESSTTESTKESKTTTTSESATTQSSSEQKDKPASKQVKKAAIEEETRTASGIIG
ncbi:hypothetical protein [Enterococcus hermanniensis]|uniref:Uncharacterized protein n=1 Tax=Enterococcus hermanniensis TaxID=249189 RepID=A0A1L8TSA2_9ENTE|nr:hypothetical protein [Enterococcus hermanniensis]OJG47093.1 hypothetical protein RV04_GL000340 [Enterococcus hermanniensis]